MAVLQKICPPSNIQNLWMLPYLGKKKVFAYVIKVRISRWDHPGIFESALNPKCFYKNVTKGDLTQREAKETVWLTIGAKTGVMGLWVKKFRQLPELGKAKNVFSPIGFRDRETHRKINFRLLDSRAVREWIYVVLRHADCGILL